MNNRYKLVGILSLVLLFLTQCYMTYYTYAWKEHDYFAALRPLVGNAYLSSLKGDLIYPGGAEVIHEFSDKHYTKLRDLYHEDTVAFRAYAKRVTDSLFFTLKEESTLDSFMQEIMSENMSDSTAQYRVSVSDFYIKVDGKDIILYSEPDYTQGITIGGDLEDCNEANRFTTILVDNIDQCSCTVRFSLWVDSPARKQEILKDILPILFLSLFCIGVTVLLFLMTYRNWARQKKLAERKQDFVNSITHELNTPLTTIIVANRNLQNPNIGADIQQVNMLSEIIERNAQWLKSLFTRVLQSEAISSSSLHLRSYSLVQVLEQILKDFELMIHARIQFKLATFGEERTVLLDKFWFTSLIINLIENGIKHNHNELIQIHLIVRFSHESVQLEIKDNGVGMRSEDMDRIFDKFYRRNDAKEGLGLGLFYVKQCVDAHGWTIRVDSQMGEGSRFIISMPLSEERN